MKTVHHKNRSGICECCGRSAAHNYKGTAQRFCRLCDRRYHKFKMQAAAALAFGIRHKLVRTHHGQTCVDCGKPAQALDHRDYRLPLQVDPVCDSCNMRRPPSKWMYSPPDAPPPQKFLPKNPVGDFPQWVGGEGDAGALLPTTGAY